MRPVALGRKYSIHIGSSQPEPKIAAILFLQPLRSHDRGDGYSWSTMSSSEL
jgi:hypothetical protein